jgi:hypothetical protein
MTKRQVAGDKINAVCRFSHMESSTPVSDTTHAPAIHAYLLALCVSHKASWWFKENRSHMHT